MQLTTVTLFDFIRPGHTAAPITCMRLDRGMGQAATRQQTDVRKQKPGKGRLATQDAELVVRVAVPAVDLSAAQRTSLLPL